MTSKNIHLPVPKGITIVWSSSLKMLPEGLFSECCDTLEEFCCSSGNISILPDDLFDKCVALRTFKCNRNNLETLPPHLFSSCKKLKHFECTRNKIKKIPASLFSDTVRGSTRPLARGGGCSSLSFFDCSNNLLTTLPSQLFTYGRKSKHRHPTYQNTNYEFPLISLKTVNCSYNRIEVLPSNLLGGRNMRVLASESTRSLGRVLSDASTRSLGDKSVNTLFGGSTLHFFACAGNRLVTLPSTLFFKCMFLQIFYCEENKLFTLPEDLFLGSPFLKIFHCHNNHMISIPEKLFTMSPTHAFLPKEYTPLRVEIFSEDEYDCDGECNGECADLCECREKMERVQRLEEEEMRGIEYKKHVSLKNFCCFNNLLEILPPLLFKDCTSLGIVMLLNNKLTSLSDELFATCTQIKELTVGCNRLTSLPFTLFSYDSKLNYLDYRTNLFEEYYNINQLFAFHGVRIIIRCKQFIYKLKYRCKSRSEAKRIAFVTSVNCRPPVLKYSDKGGIFFQEGFEEIFPSNIDE